jgi:transketolase
LSKLVVFYDSNCITIEGATSLTYSDDVRKRFEAYHWNVLEIDGHDYRAIENALDATRKEKKRPTIIIGNTCIGKGSPNLAGTAKVHGEPLGSENVKLAKDNLGLPADQEFYVSEAVKTIFATRIEELDQEHEKWLKLKEKYDKNFGDKS